jgi:hypothetical protein
MTRAEPDRNEQAVERLWTKSRHRSMAASIAAG